jgi:hypothetical protein
MKLSRKRKMQFYEKDFEEAARSINEASDQLRKAILDLEEILAQKHFGVEASIPTKLSELYLVYKKHNGKWRIYVESLNSITPLNDCSRNIRIQLSDQLDELIAEIIKQANKKSSEIKAATSNVEKVVSLLKKSEIKQDED